MTLRTRATTKLAIDPGSEARRSAAAVGTVVGAVVVPFAGDVGTVAGDDELLTDEEAPKGPGPKVLPDGMALGTIVNVVAGTVMPEAVPPCTVMVTEDSTDPVSEEDAPLAGVPEGQPGSTIVEVTPLVTTTETDSWAAARPARREVKTAEDRILAGDGCNERGSRGTFGFAWVLLKSECERGWPER
jgi:hypothetical protein